MKIDTLLIEFNACSEAREWAKGKEWQEIYETCHRGDWLLWLFRKTNPDSLKELTRAKAHCTLTIRQFMKDKRSIDACEIALKFAEGEATIEQLNDASAAAAYAAAAAADDAAAAYSAAAAAYAASAAAYAASAAAAAYAASDAAAAYAASDAAYAAAYAYSDAITKSQKETSDICRKYLPIEIWNIK